MIQKPVIIISSLGRTGTTFLADFFKKNYPSAFSVHEPGVIDFANFKTIDALKIIKHYGVINTVINKIIGKHGIIYISNQRIAGLIRLEKAAENIINLRSSYINSFNNKIYIESNYHYYGCLDVLPLVFSEFKAVYLIRDPREWVRSSINKNGLYHRKDIHQHLRNRPTPILFNDQKYIYKWKKMNQFAKLCWAWSYLNEYAMASVKNIPQIKICLFEDLFINKDKIDNLFELIYFLTHLSASSESQTENLKMALKIALTEKVNRPPTYEFPRWPQWQPKEAKTLHEICGGLMAKLGYGHEPEWKKMIA
ncbi:MAG: hypothetical protein MUC28_01430 [Planctomycetes bacterium]|jgi:hypothetical protein|nr:hypothetical protein [Planctomycetota bacterium]